MKQLLSVAALLASAALSTTAHAAPSLTTGASKVSAQGIVAPRLVVPTVADINDPFFLQGASNFSGVGGLIFNSWRGNRDGFVGLCTGALVNPQIILTAGHCFGDEGPLRIRFRTGSGTIAPDFVQYEATHFWKHPNFAQGTFFEGWDIAAVMLDSPVTNGEDIYGVFDELGADPFGQPSNERFALHQKVGFGTTGTLATGGTSFDILKRAGYNNYEFFGDEVFSDINNQVLLYDSDNGNAENDANGFLWNSLSLGSLSDTGVYYSESLGAFATGGPDGSLPPGTIDWRLVESTAAPGDSGGPTFINGKIAGITSFGITGAIFDGGCGPGFIDPSFSASFACTNSSAGELGGDTRVSAFLAELAALQGFNGDLRELNAGGVVRFKPVPAPAPLMLLGLGFAALLAGRRRV